MNCTYPLCTLLIEVTQKCNAACDQCGSRCDIHSEELLKKEDILSALADIKKNLGTDTMINITGGEPLLRDDLFVLGEQITAMGFHWGMVSNGSLLNERTVQGLKAAGMKTATISIDGLCETHDSLRHLDGCYDKIINGIRLLKKADFLEHLQVTFTANKRNISEFKQLYDILNTMGLDSVRVSIMDCIGRAEEHRSLLLSREEILYFISTVNRINSDKSNTKIVWGCPHFLGSLLDNRSFHCFTGIYTASILYNGDIFVCPNVPRKPEFVQGNILHDSFGEVWKNGFGIFRNRVLPDKCRSCQFCEKCGGDSFHTMDFEENEPMFCYRDDILYPKAEYYKRKLFEKYPSVDFCEISGEDNHEIIIEPDAYEQIRSYFHMGKRHPQSMYEQQMALVGFETENLSVVRYVIPCDGKMRKGDIAVYTPQLLHYVDSEIDIINKNYFISDDSFLCGCETDTQKPVKLLGFIHSHPVQHNLVYSIGDEIIHKRLLKRYGSYIGILVNPAECTIGAYYGEKINQAKLILPMEV